MWGVKQLEGENFKQTRVLFSHLTEFTLSKMTAIFSAVDLLVVAAGFAVWLVAVSGVSTPTISLDAPWLAVAAGASTSHILYAAVWYNPRAFCRLCECGLFQPLGRDAVSVFAVFVATAKMVQQLGVGFWAMMTVGGIGPLVEAMMVTNWMLSLALLACGQLLNASIYRAIGQDGVYYGFKLGRPVPWCYDFPFNVGFRHPQYVGGLLSQLGVLVLLTTKETVAAGMLPLVGWWTTLYALTAYMEAVGDNDVGKGE